MSHVVYTALSKHSFFANLHICAFVFRRGLVPLNPFNLFGYFLYDLVDRDTVRKANAAVIDRVDEVWSFGPIANGVAAELIQAMNQNKPVRFFSVASTIDGIKELRFEELVYEDGVEEESQGTLQALVRRNADLSAHL